MERLIDGGMVDWVVGWKMSSCTDRKKEEERDECAGGVVVKLTNR
jgi:hypothetical protein